jgi:coenzyme F420-reducing hydrogenase beta subunit
MIDATKDKENCCGCRACQAVCPVLCITMEIDNEGFLYPNIDESKCLNCGKCEKVCPIINVPANNIMEQQVYAAWSKDEKIRHDGSSGGMFETLARNCFKNNGIVFGAAFDDKLQLRHSYATNITELKPLCKSKYIQSDMSGSYENVKKYLDEKREVLFVGTPCQVAAIRNYLGRSYENLVLVDLICHGVPSQKFFDKCMQYEKKKYGMKVEGYQFRTKIKNSATPHYYTESFLKNNKVVEKIGMHYQSPYYFGFQKHITLRLSCYQCGYSNPNRISDITIADFWGIEKYLKDINRMLGVSMVIINTAQGLATFNAVIEQLETKQFTMEIAIENNECLTSATKKPIERKAFFKDLITESFDYVIKHHLTSQKARVFTLYYSLPVPLRAIVRKMFFGRIRYE